MESGKEGALGLRTMSQGTSDEELQLSSAVAHQGGPRGLLQETSMAGLALYMKASFVLSMVVLGETILGSKLY